MEKNILLSRFGKVVKETRLSMNPKMSQVAFFYYLFPNTYKTEENIKKKMNAIERGRGTNLDMTFLEAFVLKTNYSLDYIFGNNANYKSYDNEYLCNYFGLAEETIIALHKIGEDKARDLDSTVYYHSIEEKRNVTKLKAMQRADQDFANVFTTLMDFIFKDDNNPKNKYRYKETLFYVIHNYLACDAKIKNPKDHSFEYNDNSSEFTYLIDSDNRIYNIEANDYFLDIVSKRILDILDDLRKRYHRIGMPKIHVPNIMHYSVIDASINNNQ